MSLARGILARSCCGAVEQAEEASESFLRLTKALANLIVPGMPQMPRILATIVADQ